ncbi:MAG: hypothetical protein ACRC8S_08330 [Fimbriiglobus sp.]
MTLSHVLTLHLMATSFMFAIVLFVHFVHYPLMADYNRERWPSISQTHQRFTSRIVFGPMLVEVLTSLAWVGWQPGGLLAWLGLILTAVTGFTTVLVSVPLHQKLEADWSDDTHRRLCRTNGLRVVGWGGHVAVLLAATTL